MERKLIGEYLGQDLSSLPDYEAHYAEGDRGEVRFYVDRMLPEEKIQELQDSLLNEGVILTEPIEQNSRIISIKFEKRLAPLAIIAIAVGVVVVAVGAVIGWQIFKTIQWGVPVWVWLVGGGALLYLLLRKPVKKAAPLAIQAGKLYITKKALQ